MNSYTNTTSSNTAHSAASSKLTSISLKILPWVLSAFCIFVFLRYIPYKFAPGSQLFQVLEDWAGISWFEPHFRYITGGVELLACLLLTIPRVQVAGAAVALGTMTGAIFFHVFTPLGIDPYNDGAQLFIQAVGVWFSSIIVLYIRRDEILPLIKYLVVDPNLQK